MQALGCLPPSLEPKATDHVSDMVSTIEQIISNGHGYAVNGDVFFDVADPPSGYGRLSGRAQVSSHSQASQPQPWIAHNPQLPLVDSQTGTLAQSRLLKSFAAGTSTGI